MPTNTMPTQSTRLMFLVIAIGLAGCGPSEKQQKEDLAKRQRSDLQAFYTAYGTYHEEHGQGPADWDELTSFAKAEGLSLEPLQRLREEGYVVTWSKTFDASTGTLAVPPRGSDGPRLLYSGKID